MASDFGDSLIISVSQIKTYLRCPRQYELRYVRGETPSFVPVALAFGGAIHTALAFTYGMLKHTSVIPEIHSIVQVFTDAWANGTSGPVPLQVEEEDAAVDPLRKGEEMLAAFHRHLTSAVPVRVLEVEKPFLVSVHDPRSGEVLDEKLAGVIDLLVSDGDQVLLVEHKTAARKLSADQLEYDIQPTAYLHAAQELGLACRSLRYQVLMKSKTPSIQIAYVSRSLSAREEFALMVIAVLRAIEARIFYPVRGWQCRTCPFRGPCGAI